MLSLFSGIGGLDLAAEWAGIETVMFCEKDPYCRQILKKHWPTVPVTEDVRDVAKVDGIDIVCGGYPCQPFSLAGKRAGHSDVRHLWPEMFRVVRENNPTWVVGENVKGHVTLGLDAVCDDLEREGYEVRAFVLPACAVGAKHVRERVFVVAHSESIRRDVRRTTECSISETVGRSQESPGGLRCLIRGLVGRLAWLPEPRVGRVVDGVSGRLDRIRMLGNAVVPQQAYPIFKAIKEINSLVTWPLKSEVI